MGRHNNSQGGRNPNHPRGAFRESPKSVEGIARSLGFKPRLDGTYRPTEKARNPIIPQRAHILARPIGRTAAQGSLDVFDEIVRSVDGISQASKRRSTGIVYLTRNQVNEGLDNYYGRGILPPDAIQRWLDDNATDFRHSTLEPLTLDVKAVALHHRREGSYFLNVYVADVVNNGEPQVQSERAQLGKALDIADERPGLNNGQMRQYPIGWGTIVIEADKVGDELVAAARNLAPEIITLGPVGAMVTEPDVQIR